MSAPRILAIDLALTKTGMAAHDPLAEPTFPPRSPLAWTFDTERPVKLSGHAREAAIIAAIDAARRAVLPDVILLEKLYVPPKISDGWIGLCYLHGVVRHYIASTGTPFAVVHNGHIKIYATGEGGASKQDVMLAVERRYRHLVTIGDDNQADAFTLLAMGCERYGHPLSTVDGKPLPKTHTRALTMVTGWPSLNGAGPESPAGPTAAARRSGRAKREVEA